jgi:hypothetical protein
MFLDGGLRLVRLDAKSGRKLSETLMDWRDPATGKNLQSLMNRHNMPVGLPDVLSSDGRHMYMRSQVFDLEGKRELVKHIAVDPRRKEGRMHLFSPTGFLDGTWWHRSYWVYGTGFA